MNHFKKRQEKIRPLTPTEKLKLAKKEAAADKERRTQNERP